MEPSVAPEASPFCPDPQHSPVPAGGVRGQGPPCRIAQPLALAAQDSSEVWGRDATNRRASSQRSRGLWGMRKGALR